MIRYETGRDYEVLPALALHDEQMYIFIENWVSFQSTVKHLRYGVEMMLIIS